MNARYIALAVASIAVVLPYSAAARRSSERTTRTSVWSDVVSQDRFVEPGRTRSLATSAAANTLVLKSYSFDTGSGCTTNGWTSVDMTAQTGDYWHVDDFAPSNSLGTIPGGLSEGGISFTSIEGTKSLWMGKRVPPAGPVDPIHCSYLALPGYGNGWNQSFCSNDCIDPAGGPTTDLDIAFHLKYDSEASYDGLTLEYTTDCSGASGWTYIDGGKYVWSGPGNMNVTGPYQLDDVGVPVKLRLHFTSDPLWSNQDGLYVGFGAAVDSLSWETVPVEDFEGEAVGANSSDDWQSCVEPGFGNYLALYKRSNGANYEDPCRDNLSCYWAAIQGSTEFYACGVPPQPAQQVVPHKNTRGQYLRNEIWSPEIPLSGSGSEFRLRYTVYRDLPLSNLVVHQWHVRTIDGSGCPGLWKDRGYSYYGDTRDWYVADYAIGPMIDQTGGVSIQIALGVVDMCPLWCGVYGDGFCHTPAPYFDQVKVLRVDTVGPQWDVRDMDLFQDTFAADGTITGIARVDIANDIKPPTSPSITPGDSSIVLYLVDPVYASGTGTDASGLSADPNMSTFLGRHKTKRAAYMYVSVWPQGQPGKSGAPLSEGPGGQANRYPFSGTESINGVTWTKIRMDYTYSGTASNAGDGDSSDPIVAARFNVDLNDALFEPGDTICYFFGATSPAATNYYSREIGTTTDISAAAANPMELTILPAGGYRRGGYMLYVDGADGTNNQSYFDGSLFFLTYLDKTDRYDVLAPSSAVGNRLAGRVSDVVAQLNGAYEMILWDTGSMPVTLGDGLGDPEKTDDYDLLNTFLGNLNYRGGLYLCGDDVAEQLDHYSSASAITFKTLYMPFTLINGNHRMAPSLFAISPTIVHWPLRYFSDDFFIFGGCPQLNDFDVLGAQGSSLVQMSYNTSMDPNGAVLSNTNGDAVVFLSGFSFANIRDDELDGVGDHQLHLYDIICAIKTCWELPAGDSPMVNSLSQNYPNPFNPTTTISFSVATRGLVKLNVYDVAGRLVRTLANETRPAGAYAVNWAGLDNAGQPVASGVYFYRLVAGDFTQTRKMVLLK